MASTTAAAPRPTNPDERRARATRPRRTRPLAAAIVVAGLALVGACSSSSDDVVAAGPSTTDNPETPAADNPTTSAGVVTSMAGTTVVAPATPTTQPAPAASTVTSVTSVPPASSVPGPVTPDTDLVAQVFWVRAPGDPRVIDIPGYQDPPTGSKPLVVYGSVTNNGASAVDRPYVTAAWLDASGTVVATFSADVVQPGSTTPATTLGPGESGDVIIVVADQATAERLADLVPELTAAGR